MSCIVIDSVDSIKSIKGINSSNHLELTPFSAKDDIVYVERAWWSSLFVEQRRKIVASFGDYYGYAIREKIPENTVKSGPVFTQFLSAYHNSFSPENWINCLQSYCIGIDRRKTDTLTRYLKMYSDTGVYLYGKKSPIFTIEEILQDSNGKTILLTPWNYEIRKSEEFRVFIYRYHISAICQKELYRYVDLNRDKIHTIVKGIKETYEKRKVDIPYSTCVIDFWLDNKGKAHILKILPGEPWTNTKSGLFQWKRDSTKLAQAEKTFVKFIDSSSPLLRSFSGIQNIQKIDLNGGKN